MSLCVVFEYAAVGGHVTACTYGGWSVSHSYCQSYLSLFLTEAEAQQFD